MKYDSCLVLWFSFTLPLSSVCKAVETDEMTFNYFAYGSNLLQKRLHRNNPTAVRKGIAKLKNYRLDFDYWSKRWGGHAATIVPDQDEFVWGAVWEINKSNLPDLDKQEGVDKKVYEAIEVPVELEGGKELKCRTYLLTSLPKKEFPLPQSRYPSKVYMDTIVSGAVESKLPEDYIQKLRNIPHNSFTGPVNYDYHLSKD